MFTLTPSGYPGNYDNYAHCVWLIEVPIGYCVKLTVGELRTVHAVRTGGCLDYLEVCVQVELYSGVILDICNIRDILIIRDIRVVLYNTSVLDS